MSGGGVAFPLWRRLEDERVGRNISKVELAALTGLPRSTYNDLQKTSRPKPHVVHLYADALGVPREEAERLAGLRSLPGGEQVSVRRAIEQSATFTPRQKAALLGLIDDMEAANRARAGATIDGHSDDAKTAI